MAVGSGQPGARTFLPVLSTFWEKEDKHVEEPHEWVEHAPDHRKSKRGAWNIDENSRQDPTNVESVMRKIRRHGGFLHSYCEFYCIFTEIHTYQMIGHSLRTFF